MMHHAWMKLVLTIPCLVSGLQAQPAGIERAQPRAIEPPPLASAARKAIDSEFLSDHERRNLRIFHGDWTEADLDTPARRASAALIRGAYNDPSLQDPTIPVEDRAEAMLIRGELAPCLDLLAEVSSIRAARLRAAAHEGLGQFAKAGEALDPLVKRMQQRDATPAELVEGVRGLIIRARVLPQKEPAGGDFNRMLSILTEVHQKRDRLFWPALVAEAELLYEKSNIRQAGEAAIQALSLNPRSAAAWAILGRISVDQFNFDRTEGIAAMLSGLLESEAQPSPLAADIRARAALRQSDPDGADAALEPALARYPLMRRLLALKAAATAIRYNPERTAADLAAFEALSPGSALALFEVGRTLAEARQYEMAAGYLESAAERNPYWAEPATELGLMGLQSGDDASALKFLKRASELDPFNTRVTNSLSLANELTRYKRLETEHFIIRYAEGADEVLAVDMAEPLEAMYRRVTGNGPGGIDHEPPFKTVIDLMPNQRWFAVRIAGVTRIHTMAASTGPTIAMEAPREGPGHKVGSYDWLRVVQHEFTHTVTLSRTRNRIPHWFTEAAAVHLEDSPRDYSTCKLLEGALLNDALLDFGDINIAFVRPKRPTDRQQAYAQGQWMYEFIITQWGNRAPLDLMDQYAAGIREPDAIKAVLDLDQSEFMTRFKDWARRELRKWGMGEWEPSMKQLLKESAGAGGEGKPADPTLDTVLAWLEKHPEHPDIQALAIRLTLESPPHDGIPDESMVPLLERYAKARPVDPLPHKLLTRLYTSRAAGETWPPERAALAVPHLEYLDAREQNSAAYAAELARAYQTLGDLERAAAKAKRACTIAPYDANMRELYATILLQRNDLKGAEHQIVALTKLEPDRAIHAKRLDAIRKRLSDQN